MGEQWSTLPTSSAVTRPGLEYEGNESLEECCAERDFKFLSVTTFKLVYLVRKMGRERLAEFLVFSVSCGFVLLSSLHHTENTVGLM